MPKKVFENQPVHEIGLICLERIPEIDKDYIVVGTYDLSVTQLKIPAESIVKKKGRERTYETTPLILFILKTTDDQSASLSDVLLPSQSVLCSKCEIIDDKSEYTMKGNKKKYTKITFDCTVFTRQSLKKTQKTWDELQSTIEEMKIRYKRDLDKMKDDHDERLNNYIEPYKENERKMKKKIEEQNVEILNLHISLPEKRNENLKNALKKKANSS
jgi:hypothetical protein